MQISPNQALFHTGNSANPLLGLGHFSSLPELLQELVGVIGDNRVSPHHGPFPSGDYILEDYDINQPELEDPKIQGARSRQGI